MKTEILEARECELCREALLIVRESSELGHLNRIIALDQKDKTKHVCFDLPQDANLLVMEDQE
jgi:hypothetical protein